MLLKILVFFSIITTASNSAIGQTRGSLVEVLQGHCGIESTTWCAAGYSTQEVTFLLSDLDENSPLPEQIVTVTDAITSISQEINSCKLQLRSPKVFESETPPPTPEELEDQLSDLNEALGIQQIALTHSVSQLRILALGSRLSEEQILRVTGTDSRWGSLPLHWRFGEVPEDEFTILSKSSQEASRLNSSSESIPYELASILSSIVSQYPVSLAKVNIDTNIDAMDSAIALWISND